jgi:hypothetical protein
MYVSRLRFFKIRIQCFSFLMVLPGPVSLPSEKTLEYVHGELAFSKLSHNAVGYFDHEKLKCTNNEPSTCCLRTTVVRD